MENENLFIDVLDVFMETFIPGTRGDHDEQMATSDICDHIADISGIEPEKSMLIQLLKENGYTFAWADTGFKWMLKYKP